MNTAWRCGVNNYKSSSPPAAELRPCSSGADWSERRQAAASDRAHSCRLDLSASRTDQQELEREQVRRSWVSLPTLLCLLDFLGYAADMEAGRSY